MGNLSAHNPLSESHLTPFRIALSHPCNTLLAAHSLAQFSLAEMAQILLASKTRRRDITKILYWDRNGFCLFQKRLEKHKFQWPETTRGVLHIHGHELS